MAIGFAQSELAVHALRVLEHLVVLPRRLTLAFAPQTTADECELQRLRGVWGAALHGLDQTAYTTVFHPPHSEPPKYIIRPAAPSADRTASFEFILIGSGISFDEPSLRAWDVASGMGLGKARHAFHVRSRGIVDAAGRPTKRLGSWPVTRTAWPMPGEPETTPCCLHFRTPVALQHNRQLIRQPSLKDVVAKGCRRIESLLDESCLDQWQQLRGELIESTERVVALSQFQPPLGIARYSGSQRQDFPIGCVAGRIDLPAGPGPAWPVLAALQWLHVGKGTNIGLGQLAIATCEFPQRGHRQMSSAPRLRRK